MLHSARYREAGSDEEASNEESEESEESEGSRCSSPANAQLGLKVGSKMLHATQRYTATVLELCSASDFLHTNKVLVVYESYDKAKRKNVARERWCFSSDLELVRASPRKAARTSAEGVHKRVISAPTRWPGIDDEADSDVARLLHAQGQVRR